ncbi:MAG: cytochrome c-type biogenesis protein CcmH, partial [Pseudomonas stutzeri]|nr:cytochrome c-type biogenesis protein CcmH [Stutzerimonas stutzeri]NIM69537.1 cytochrome c-type biogenesis protein CcmH [Xanthomonadales bacterium]NIN83081.1 cytochrome c-type biogenesis protein CcmH [Stutzerimonas stutzeri]NIO12433.1 cytochrome c-type biogenesis protein CcmH [Xanthomonadales bacterium]NIP03214.1 cytochrome c-type biogenesis protein CcmH [Stutzerimonas stutzeri]
MADLRLGAIVCLLLLSGAALGAGPVDVYDFPDPATEARYRVLIAEFR